MTRKAQEITEERHDLEERRKYHAAVVSALAEKVGRFAEGLRAKRPNRRKADEATQQIWAVQTALPTALMELHNSLAVELDAAKN